MKNVTKSLTALLLALVMSLTLLPTQVLAAESGIAARSSTGTVYATEYVNPIYADVLQSGTGIRIQAIPSAQAAVAAQAADSVNYLTEAEAVKELRKQMIARNENITLSVKLSSGDNVGAAVKRIWESAQGHVSGYGTAGDYLRWQYGGFSCPKFTYSDDGKYITFTVTYQRAASRSSLWYTTAEQETQLTSYIKSTILPQLALDGKTTYQKVQAIYDWMTKNIKYDDTKDDGSYMLKYTAYAAAMNCLLAWENCRDDWADEKKLSAAAAGGMLAPGAKKAAARYPEKAAAIRRALGQIAQAEADRTGYSETPANAFGDLMAELFTVRDDRWTDGLRRFARSLGKLIYFMDAACDLQADRKKGQYNPLLLLGIGSGAEFAPQLRLLAGDAAEEFERLPIVQDAELLQNILYSGVWTRFEAAFRPQQEEQA